MTTSELICLRCKTPLDPQADACPQCSEKVTQFQPDVMVMDIYMPRRNGLETTLSVKQKFPNLKILLLTVSEQEADLFQAIRYGADGYILKNSEIEDVPNAVRQLASGKAILSSWMTARLMREFRDSGKEPLLTDREKQVLELISEGLTTAKIAERLVLSQGTVSTYIYRLLQKLHLKNKAEAVAYYIRHLRPAEPS